MRPDDDAAQLQTLRELLPRNKFDTARVAALAALGYPAIAPLLPDLMIWLQDMNWPAAMPVASLLRSVGNPLLPEIQRVMATDDLIWKYWVLRKVVAHSHELTDALRPEVERLAFHPTPAEAAEYLDEAAQEVLAAVS